MPCSNPNYAAKCDACNGQGYRQQEAHFSERILAGITALEQLCNISVKGEGYDYSGEALRNETWRGIQLRVHDRASSGWLDIRAAKPQRIHPIR